MFQPTLLSRSFPLTALLPAIVLLLALRPAGAASAVEQDPADGQWPVQPRPEVVDGFDPPASPWGAGHRGVDLRGSVGQPVVAARAGVVSFAGRIAGRGVVVVDHGARRTTYEPVVAAGVQVGDRVAEGDRIGTLALFGSHCFPDACLHWGLIEGEEYLDPLTLVGAGPVRLLPLFGPSAALAIAPAPGPVPQLPGWRPVGSAQLFRG